MTSEQRADRATKPQQSREPSHRQHGPGKHRVGQPTTNMIASRHTSITECRLHHRSSRAADFRSSSLNCRPSCLAVRIFMQSTAQPFESVFDERALSVLYEDAAE